MKKKLNNDIAMTSLLRGALENWLIARRSKGSIRIAQSLSRNEFIVVVTAGISTKVHVDTAASFRHCGRLCCVYIDSEVQ